MLVVGIDPSSSCSGVAYVEHSWDKEPEQIDTMIWTPEKHQSAPQRLVNYFDWLRNEALVERTRHYLVPRAQMGCVEFLSVTRNAATTRVVSHYQAASVLALKKLGITTIEARVSSARATALGRSGSKEEAWDAVKRLYPDHVFHRKTKGGMDETDAVVLALAGPTLAEK
jgi:Holliday junction resolvasome RuvABC endonuclease subunit